MTFVFVLSSYNIYFMAVRYVKSWTKSYEKHQFIFRKMDSTGSRDIAMKQILWIDSSFNLLHTAFTQVTDPYCSMVSGWKVQSEFNANINQLLSRRSKDNYKMATSLKHKLFRHTSLLIQNKMLEVHLFLTLFMQNKKKTCLLANKIKFLKKY